MRFLKLNRVAGAISAGIMSGLALTAIMIGKFALHSQFVALNIYSNGSTDWAMDATAFLKSLFVLMFVIFAAGLALGALVTRRD
jgi:hypothetical protein